MPGKRLLIRRVLKVSSKDKSWIKAVGQKRLEKSSRKKVERGKKS